jgi:hypothetical protein
MASLLGQTTPSGGWSDATGSTDSVEYILSTGIQFAVAGTISGVWYFVPTTIPTNAQFAIGAIKVNSGVLTSPSIVASEAQTKPASGDAGTWKLFTFTTPVAVAAGDKFLICVRTNRYALKSHFFQSAAVVNGNLTGWQDAPTAFPNGCFKNSGLGTNIGAVPTQSFDQSFYGIDADFTASGGGGTDATATPSTVAGTTTIGTPTLTKGTTATPSTVAGAVSVPTPTVGVGSSATATPTRVNAVASIPTPTVVVPTNATATPARVNGAVSIPQPLIVAGSEWILWDGQREVQLILAGVWNGASIDPLTFDEVIA